jgi:hypothetical protein
LTVYRACTNVVLVQIKLAARLVKEVSDKEPQAIVTVLPVIMTLENK